MLTQELNRRSFVPAPTNLGAGILTPKIQRAKALIEGLFLCPLFIMVGRLQAPSGGRTSVAVVRTCFRSATLFLPVWLTSKFTEDATMSDSIYPSAAVADIYFHEHLDYINALLDSILTAHFDDESLMCADSVRRILELTQHQMHDLMKAYSCVASEVLTDSQEVVQ